MKAVYCLLLPLILLGASCKKEKNNTPANKVTDPYAYVDAFCGTYNVRITGYIFDNKTATPYDTAATILVVNKHTTGSPSKGSTLPVVDINYESGANICYHLLDDGGELVSGANVMGKIQNHHIAVANYYSGDSLSGSSAYIEGDLR